MKKEIQQIFANHDEKDTYEFPSHFDYDRLEARAKIVQRRLEEQLSERTVFEGAIYNQDASFSIAIIFKEREKTEKNYIIQPALRFSNFGDMTNIGWDDLFEKEEMERIEGILNEEGFIYISNDELEKNYDGVMKESSDFPNWRTRFFDWI